MNDKNQVKQFISNKLKQLNSELKVDFSAIAFYDPFNQEFRWRLAEGSLNNRYMNIVVRNNRGICGKVLKTRKELIVNHFPEQFQDDALEYPILIIEELKSALAIPLIFQSQIFGILLVGERSPRNFQQTDIDVMKIIANDIMESYLIEQQENALNENNEKSVEDTPIYHFFAKKRIEKGDRLEILLLDQRITLLRETVKQDLISIFDYLLERCYSVASETRVRVLIEASSEQQFTVRVEINNNLEFPETEFSQFASKLRKMNGSIEMAYEEERTIITMNFPLSFLI